MPNPSGTNQYTKGTSGRTVGRKGNKTQRNALAKAKLSRRAANASGSVAAAKSWASTEKHATKMLGGDRKVTGRKRKVAAVANKAKATTRPSGAQGGSRVASSLTASAGKPVRKPWLPSPGPLRSSAQRATIAQPKAAVTVRPKAAVRKPTPAKRVGRRDPGTYGPGTTIGRAGTQMERSFLASHKSDRRAGSRRGPDWGEDSMERASRSGRREEALTADLGGARRTRARKR